MDELRITADIPNPQTPDEWRQKAKHHRDYADAIESRLPPLSEQGAGQESAEPESLDVRIRRYVDAAYNVAV